MGPRPDGANLVAQIWTIKDFRPNFNTVVYTSV